MRRELPQENFGSHNALVVRGLGKAFSFLWKLTPSWLATLPQSRHTHTHKVPALSQVPAEAVEEHPTGSGMQQEVPVTDPELLQWNSTLGIFKRSVIILFRNKSSAFA